MATLIVTASITADSPANEKKLSPPKVLSKKTRRPRLVTRGPVQRQLLRDTVHRYGPNVSAAEIYRDPEREYSKYNDKSVQKMVESTRQLAQNCFLAQKVGCYDSLSLEDRAFLESGELDREPDEAEKNGSRLFVPSNSASSFNMTAPNAKIVEMAKRLAEAEAKIKQITSDNHKLQSEKTKLQAKFRNAVDEKLSMQAMCEQMGNERDKLKSANNRLNCSLDQIREGWLVSIVKDNKKLDELNARLEEHKRRMEILQTRKEWLRSVKSA